MTQIILNDNQAQAVTNATDAVELRDEQGNLLGYISRRTITSEQIANAKRRAESDGPWYTTEEVFDKLTNMLKVEQGVELGPLNQSNQKWCEQFDAWAKGHTPHSEEADDSRESIYQGRGE